MKLIKDMYPGKAFKIVERLGQEGRRSQVLASDDPEGQPGI